MARDSYLLGLVRYIHLNLVGVGVVKDAGDYQETGPNIRNTLFLLLGSSWLKGITENVIR
ncbi:MAG: hypothetical protein ACE5HC_17260 [Candidatus Binatia bacterium]